MNKTNVLLVFLLVVSALWFFNLRTQIVRDIDAQVGVETAQQFNPDRTPEEDNAFSDLAHNGFVNWLDTILVVAVLATLVVRFNLHKLVIERRNRRVLPLLVLSVVVIMTSAACIKGPKPADEVHIIEPYQTAFLIPYQQVNEQEQFRSIDYLQQNQVAIELVRIPHFWLETGGLPPGGRWQISARLIVVDRTLVTREWTSDPETGTDNSVQGFNAESRESIDFDVPIVASARILDQNAATFLYNYPNQSLATVMDTDIRGFIQGELTEIMAEYYLSDANANKASIFSDLQTRTTEEFAQYGITIVTLGAAGGFSYDDPNIQEAINLTFQNDRAVESAEAEADAARIRAQGEADALVIQAEAEAEALRLVGDELANNPLIIDYTIAQSATGEVPEVLVISDGQSGELPFSFLLSTGNNESTTQSPGDPVEENSTQDQPVVEPEVTPEVNE